MYEFNRVGFEKFESFQFIKAVFFPNNELPSEECSGFHYLPLMMIHPTSAVLMLRCQNPHTIWMIRSSFMEFCSSDVIVSSSVANQRTILVKIFHYREIS